MPRSRTRLAVLFAALFAFLTTAAIFYDIGMRRLEHQPRSFKQSFAWAVETLTTTGFGFDNHWTHPLMVTLVVMVELVGVFLPPLIVALYLVPVLAQRFEQRVPRRADEHLGNHVIVYRYGPAVETLLTRLHDSNVRTLVVEIDESQARAVMEKGQAVVFSRSEEESLDAARLERARAVVANGRDEENAALILRARQMGFTGEMYAFVENPTHRKPMELAGATSAYTPRHIIAAALAAYASDLLSPRLPGLEKLDGLKRREIRVPPGSPFAGKTIGEAALAVAVVGVWYRSRLESRCTPDLWMEPGAVLEVVGDENSLDETARAIGARYLRSSGPFLIAGFGEVGRKVHELLTDVGEEVRVIERQQVPGVDVVGDVLDASVLDKAGLATTRALILALDSDDATLFATVIARDLAEDVPVIARVNHARNVENIHRAGADYALSISDISGEMLSSRLLGRGARARDEHRRVVRIEASKFAPGSIGDLCLLAIERAGKVTSRHDEPLASADAVWVCGTAEAIKQWSA